MSTPEPITRDDMPDYRRKIVKAAAHIRADHVPAYEFELAICKEADRYIEMDAELENLYGIIVLERQGQKEHRAQINRSLARQHDVIADKLDNTVAKARRIIPKMAGEPRSELYGLIVDFGDILASILLLVTAELHDDA